MMTEFAGHPYANDPDGTVDDLKKITKDNIKQRAAALLMRTGLIVAAVGDIDEVELSRLLDSAFGGLPAGTPPALPPQWKPPTRARTLVVERPVPQSTALIASTIAIHSTVAWPRQSARRGMAAHHVVRQHRAAADDGQLDCSLALVQGQPQRVARMPSHPRWRRAIATPDEPAQQHVVLAAATGDCDALDVHRRSTGTEANRHRTRLWVDRTGQGDRTRDAELDGAGRERRMLRPAPVRLVGGRDDARHAWCAGSFVRPHVRGARSGAIEGRACERQRRVSQRPHVPCGHRCVVPEQVINRHGPRRSGADRLRQTQDRVVQHRALVTGVVRNRPVKEGHVSGRW